MRKNVRFDLCMYDFIGHIRLKEKKQKQNRYRVYTHTHKKVCVFVYTYNVCTTITTKLLPVRSCRQCV